MNELLKKLGLIASLSIAAFSFTGCADDDASDMAEEMGDEIEEATD